jgi:hypothetical protein
VLDGTALCDSRPSDDRGVLDPRPDRQALNARKVRVRYGPNLLFTAVGAMNGSAWYFGPVAMNVTLSAPALEKGKRLVDYIAGIQDTLDGSSGCEFTYLPIVFEDDCQVVGGRSRFVKTEKVCYEVEVEFMSNGPNRDTMGPKC